MTLARPEQTRDSVERLVFGGERRATGEIAKFAGDEQARDLWIVEAGEDTAKQVAIGLRQAQ
jgi:hypothetical protein